jgi:hypothetical protein
MSIVDERDLRQQLDRILDAIMPPDAPPGRESSFRLGAAWGSWPGWLLSLASALAYPAC